MVPSEISTALKPNMCACCINGRQLPCTMATSKSVPPGYVRMPRAESCSSLRRSTSAGTKAEVPKVHFQWSIQSPHISSRSAVADGLCPLSMTIVNPLLRGGCACSASKPPSTCAHARSDIRDLLPFSYPNVCKTRLSGQLFLLHSQLPWHEDLWISPLVSVSHWLHRRFYVIGRSHCPGRPTL